MSYAQQESEFQKNEFLIIDFEGYYYYDNFFFKEFGFYDYSTINTFYIQTKKLNFLNYNWLVKYFHKIPFDYGTTPFSFIKQLLNQHNKVFVVKGLEKQKIIEKLTKNKVVNIEDFGCPSFKSINCESFPCVYHSIIACSEHCVKIKLSKIVHWIQNEYGASKVATRYSQDISTSR
jgi:hypothetical protein